MALKCSCKPNHWTYLADRGEYWPELVVGRPGSIQLSELYLGDDEPPGEVRTRRISHEEPGGFLCDALPSRSPLL
jgi:hypothetical protein